MEPSRDPESARASNHYSSLEDLHFQTAIHEDTENQSVLQNVSHDDPNNEKAPKDPNVVDWDGPNDPANPLNWSSSKKLAAISIVSLVTMLS